MMMPHRRWRPAAPVIVLALAAAATTARGEGDPISREDLVKVLTAAHAKIHDVEYLYEGRHRRLQSLDYDRVPPQNRSPEPPDLNDPNRGTGFQGRFAYRDDGAAHLDLYTWSATDERNPPRREVSCLRGDGKILSRSYHPGSAPVKGYITKPGWIVSLFGGYLPLRLYTFPLLLAFLKQPTLEYEFGGWETVDGRECLVIRLHSGHEGSMTDTFWIDLERQGHPLRYEHTSGKQRLFEVTDVRLRTVSTGDGEVVWFPVGCRYLHYRDLFTASRRPVFEEEQGIVRDTLRINQGLPDSRFSIDYQPASPSPPLAWRDAAAAAARKADIDGSRSTEARLEEQLAAAGRRAPELEASAPSRQTWIARYAMPLGVFATGATLIGLAVALKWRMSW